MVRDVFRLAKENAPAIIFIDEVDAIATARFDAQTGADREVQRILMELLNQVDFGRKKLEKDVRTKRSKLIFVTHEPTLMKSFDQSFLSHFTSITHSYEFG